MELEDWEPTPQQELDWAIHNDHSDGIEPDVDYDDWQAQYDDDPNPYHGDYSEE